MTTKKPVQPLTPAQVEVVKQLINDRQDRLRAEVTRMITEQVEALAASLAPAIDASIKYGERVALRAASGKVIGADQGGPTADGQPFEFVGKTTVAAHESFTTERGQG